MRRLPVLVALIVVLAALTLPAMGVAPTADGAEHNETAPGEQLAGVVGVQEAELDGDLDRRAFGVQFAQTADNESRADVVATRVGDVDERLATLQERTADLEDQRAAGELPEGAYRAQVARLAAESRLLSQAANQTELAAAELPPGLLEERGVDGNAIQRLQQNASNLAGPEVAAIAREIAGPAVGEPPGGANRTGPPAHAGGPPEGTAGDPGPENQPAGQANESSAPAEQQPAQPTRPTGDQRQPAGNSSDAAHGTDRPGPAQDDAADE